MENNIATRLKIFIEHTGMNNSQFADTCSIPKPSLSQILSGRNKKVSNQLLELLHYAFPSLNISWLIFGEGDMLNSTNTSGQSDSTPFDTPADEVRSEPMAYYGKNATEISFLPTDNTEMQKEQNLSGLTASQNTTYPTDFKHIESNLQIKQLQLQIEELRTQIEKIRENPRKVSTITIYYDDSTFETFIPG